MELYKYRNESENKKNVLNTIFDYNKKDKLISRNILSEVTGLSLPTIIKFISEFMSDGVVEEFAELNPPAGRKPISLRISLIMPMLSVWILEPFLQKQAF